MTLRIAIAFAILCLVLIVVVGCRGIALSEEESVKVEEINTEIKLIQAKIKAMVESGNVDTAEVLAMYVQINELREKESEILAIAKDRGFKWYEYAGLFFGQLLTYLGARGVRRRFFPQPQP